MKNNRIKYVLGGGSLLNIVGITLIIVTLIVAFVYNLTSTGCLTSDMSSEMVLAELLSEKMEIMSTDWYYSTELRTINNQIIMMLLFKIFDDYSLIRAIGNSILLLGMLGSGFFMLTKLGIQKKSIFLPLSFIILPFSDYQWLMVLTGAFYIPHVTISFIVLGYLFQVINDSQEKYGRIPLYTFSFLAGLGGIRYLLILFLPLCLAGVWGILESADKKVYWKENIHLLSSVQKFRYIISMTVFSVFGFFVYSFILPNYYTYASYNQVRFIDLDSDNIGERLFKIISATINSVLGYYNDVPVFSLEGVSNICVFACISIITIFLIIIWKNKIKYDLYIRYLICANIFNGFVFLFTNEAFSSNTFVSRYYGPILIPLFLSMAVFDEIVTKKIYKSIFYTGLILSLIILSISHILSCTKVDLNGNRQNSLNYLLENNMNFGYATFWNANITTELTDGRIEMASVYGFENMEPYKWLCPKNYFEQDYSSDPCFILMTKEEQHEYGKSKFVLNGKKEYEDDYYVIYSYPNSKMIYNMIE